MVIGDGNVQCRGCCLALRNLDLSRKTEDASVLGYCNPNPNPDWLRTDIRNLDLGRTGIKT